MPEYGRLLGFSFPPRVYFGGQKTTRKASPMTDTADRPTSLTRLRLLLSLGSAAGAGAISPAPAAVPAVVPPSGSEYRVSQIELDGIVARHQLWLDRKTGRALANFGGRDLSGLKFGRWDLRHASFAGANLSGIHATDTRFCYCDFTAADLDETDLRYARINTKFNDAVFEEAY
jgi:hypothetical protein